MKSSGGLTYIHHSLTNGPRENVSHMRFQQDSVNASEVQHHCVDKKKIKFHEPRYAAEDVIVPGGAEMRQTAAVAFDGDATTCPSRKLCPQRRNWNREKTTSDLLSLPRLGFYST